MSKSVLGRILIKNHNQLLKGVVKEHINCEFAKVDQLYWLVPVLVRSVPYYYKPVISTTKPTADSVNSVRIKDTRTGFTYYVALTDSAKITDFSDACNACCDAVTPLPAVTVPNVLEEQAGCLDSGNNYNYFTLAPALQSGEVYYAYGSKNGVAFTPAYQNQGYADVASFITWANANWSAYGTFSNPAGQKVNLATSNGVSGFIKLVRSKYFESNAPTALVSGHHYTLNATLDGAVLPTITGVADGALSTLATLANADATWSSYGTWSVVANKVRLVSQTVAVATLLATNV